MRLQKYWCVLICIYFSRCVFAILSRIDSMGISYEYAQIFILFDFKINNWGRTIHRNAYCSITMVKKKK